MISSIALPLLLATAARAQVIADGPNGPTNPAAPTLGTPINQTSMSRLITLNSFDDFCLFAPPEYVADTTTSADGTVHYKSTIGDTEAIEVAWCTKPRNNARLIPDGVITAAHFIKTPLYVQIRGYGDLTQLNIPYGDQGGELDPHGATGAGNPIGGNVTSNISGSDVFYEEWMMFVSYSQFCLRICINENSTYSAAQECEHKIDELGCDWVMPGATADNSFTSCDGDSAYPPGVYPLPGGGYSTFAQYFTGQYTDNGVLVGYTVGTTVTPSAAASTPASSNCNTYSSFGNGISQVQINPQTNQGALTATGDGSSPTVTSSRGNGTGVIGSAGDKTSTNSVSGSTKAPNKSAAAPSAAVPYIAFTSIFALVFAGGFAILI